MKNLTLAGFGLLFSLINMTSVQAEHDHSIHLDTLLNSQAAETQARYQYRHPKETLEFFGIKPGMTVVEVLPGRGWYSQLLIPYLGADGALIGADYALDMLPKFGFFSDERLEKKKTWIADWTAEANSWNDKDAATVSAFVLGSMPAKIENSADVVLFIRALHNLYRFENEGGYFTTALKEAYAVLKPGGILGVVQHQAGENMPDDWAQGAKGYLKKSLVIEKLTQAGFEFVAASPINENPKDQPAADDIVWRLPPSYASSKNDDALKQKYQAIGESNRMTLKFRKP